MAPDIDQVVQAQRIQTTSGALIFLYFPLGILLTIFRICLSINYVCAQVVFSMLCSPNNVIRRGFERIYLGILGVFVVWRNFELRDKSSLLVANKLTNIDGICISALCNCLSVDQLYFNGFLTKLFRTTNRLEALSSEELQKLKCNGTSLFIQPEPFPTTGAALLKFSDRAFASNMAIQPVTLKLKRPLLINGSKLDSTWWQDLLWSYFCIATVYEVTFHPTLSKEKDETSVAFSNRIRQFMAKALNIPCSNYDASDVKELIKRKRFEAKRPQEHLKIQESSLTPKFKLMVKQVKDVLPHVPTSVIINDIAKTLSVDITVTNLLEGVVKFSPEPIQKPCSSKADSVVISKQPSSFSRNPDVRHMSLQERKEAFLQQARANYLKKHGGTV